MYKLARFSRGKATSFALSISGSTKFPSAAGMDGMMNRKTMITPCNVKTRLYVFGVENHFAEDGMLLIQKRQAEHEREHAAQEERRQDHGQVHDPDALV